MYVHFFNEIPTQVVRQSSNTSCRKSLWCKTQQAFKYVYENHFDDADWFLKADDDTYVVVDNLRSFVADRDPADPVYFGFNFKVHVRQGYMSGGAGYVLSKEAVRRFVLKGLGSRCVSLFRFVRKKEAKTFLTWEPDT